MTLWDSFRKGVIVSCLVLLCPTVTKAEQYEVDKDYAPALPAGLQLGAVAGVAVDSQGNMIVSHRGPRPILVYDSAGKLLHMFGDEELTGVHGTRVDPQDDIWVTDYKSHTVLKYSTSGKLLLVLGKRDVAGADDATFNRPTDVAFAPDGHFFVTDGYGNNRVVKFTREGRFVKAWGKKGTGDGELHLPHCIQIDAEGLLHVADRENDRIQVFDQEGRFVRRYGGFAPFGLCIAADQTLFVADGRANQCLHMTRSGKVLSEWGAKGSEPGQFLLPHCMAVDRNGAVYVGDVDGKRLQRFVLR